MNHLSQSNIVYINTTFTMSPHIVEIIFTHGEEEFECFRCVLHVDDFFEYFPGLIKDISLSII